VSAERVIDPSQEDELDVFECLEDYHRILVNVATNRTGGNGSNKRSVATVRATMVRQLIDRLRAEMAEDFIPGEEPLEQAAPE
jgi:hypothetical protein